MQTLFTVLCLAVVAKAAPGGSGEDTRGAPEHVKPKLTTNGEQYKLYQTYTDAIPLAETAIELAHKGLNIKQGDDLKKDDFELWYWHNDVKFAVEVAFAKLNTDGDDKISKDELKKVLSVKEFKVAVVECKYIPSEGLARSCYADQILTYLALVLPENKIEPFFKFMDINGDLKINDEDFKVLEKEHKLDNIDTKTMIEEIGKGDDIDKDELKSYVLQESVGDDFRRCRKGSKWTLQCLLEELVEYVHDDLTEMDISVLFFAVDKDDDKKITSAEIKAFVKNADADKVIKMLDTDKTQNIDYGEFRTYLKSGTVVVRMERECTETHATQAEEIDCLSDLLRELFFDLHTPIDLVVPDLDQTIAFEILDTTDDAMIKREDLQKLSGSSFTEESTQIRFVDEFDHDLGGYTCLEEFQEYMDVPHMVYATCDCLLVSRTKPDDRKKSFITEIADTVRKIRYVRHGAFENIFIKYYLRSIDAKKFTKIHLKGIVEDSKQENFIAELGQKGTTVESFEFCWYSKKQDFSHIYEGKLKIKQEVRLLKDYGLFNSELVNFVENVMTDYDIDELFKTLDKDQNEELDENDLKKVFTDNAKLDKAKEKLNAMDQAEAEGDKNGKVNIREFWLYFHTKSTGTDIIKTKYTKECTAEKPTQAEEMECYKTLFSS